MIFLILYIIILNFSSIQAEYICQNDYFNVSRFNNTRTNGFENFWIKSYGSHALYEASISNNSCQWIAINNTGSKVTIKFDEFGNTENSNTTVNKNIFGTRNEKKVYFNYSPPRNNITLHFSCDKWRHVNCSIEVKFVNELPEKPCSRLPNLIGKGLIIRNLSSRKNKYEPNEEIQVICNNGYKSKSFCKNGYFLPKNLTCTVDGTNEKRKTTFYLYIVISCVVGIIALLFVLVFKKNKIYCFQKAPKDKEVVLPIEEVNNPIYTISNETKDSILDKCDSEKLEKQNPIYNLDEEELKTDDTYATVYDSKETFQNAKTVKEVVQETYAVVQKKSSKKKVLN